MFTSWECFYITVLNNIINKASLFMILYVQTRGYMSSNTPVNGDMAVRFQWTCFFICLAIPHISPHWGTKVASDIILISMYHGVFNQT